MVEEISRKIGCNEKDFMRFIIQIERIPTIQSSFFANSTKLITFDAPIWESIRLIILLHGFNSDQSFGQWLKFLTNLTNLLRIAIRKNSIVSQTVVLGRTSVASVNFPLVRKPNYPYYLEMGY